MQRLDGKFARGGHPAPAAQGVAPAKGSLACLAAGTTDGHEPRAAREPLCRARRPRAHGTLRASVRPPPSSVLPGPSSAVGDAPARRVAWGSRRPVRADVISSARPPAPRRSARPLPPCGRCRRRRQRQHIAMHQRRCPARRSARLAPPPARVRAHMGQECRPHVLTGGRAPSALPRRSPPGFFSHRARGGDSSARIGGDEGGAFGERCDAIGWPPGA